MEQMRVVLITLLLFIGAAVAEVAGNGKAINPAEDASVVKAINPAEDASVVKAINPAEDASVVKAINPAEDASVVKAINPAEDASVVKAINPAEDASVVKAINPAEDASVGEAINPAEDASVGEAINPAEDASVGEAINPAEDAGIGDAITPAEGKASNLQAYESPRFKKLVTHCSSHVAQTCSGNDPLHHEGGGGINSPFGLSFCLFDSMEKCLVDHEASLIDPQDNHGHLGPMSALPKSIQYQPLLIETVKFRTVLKTCSHVSAQSCFTAPNVATSVLAACLMPSLNQCVYPAAGLTP